MGSSLRVSRRARRVLLGAAFLAFVVAGACGPRTTVVPAPAGRCAGARTILHDGKPTGLEICASGLRHRAAAVDCPAPPRRQRLGKTAAFLSPEGYCTVDEDCANHPHGYCSQPLPHGRKRCTYSCVRDSECGKGRICFCGGSGAGMCVPASCRSSDDCAAPFLCSTYSPNPDCFLSDGFACQSERDECAVDEDCGRKRACGWDGERRVCVKGGCNY